MEAQTQPIRTNLGHDRLLEALFFFWDGFDRSLIDFFLVGNTLDDVMNDRDLSGDRITLGVRENEWIGGQSRIFKAFVEHERIPVKKVAHNLFKLDFKGVIVLLAVYPDSQALRSLDIAFYRNETFHIPNPVTEYIKFKE